MTDNRLMTAIDSCRADRDELSQDEFQELAALLPDRPDLVDLLQRSHEFDARATEALEDVPIPAGLESRLLERLRGSQVPPAPSDELKVELAKQQPPPRTLGWRSAAAVVAATAAAIAVAFAWQGAQQDDAPQTLADRQDVWFEAVRSQPPWQVTAAPAELPISNQIAAGRAPWIQIDAATVAYRLTAAGSRHASYLFATKQSALGEAVQGLPPTPPRQPFWTEGRGVGRWREHGVVYVLLVEGPVHRYREALRPNHRGSLANQLRPASSARFAVKTECQQRG